MIESLGLPLHQAILLGLLGLAYLLFAFFPFLWPAVISFRKSPVLPHRLKLCGLVGLLVYGVFTAISLCVGIPIEAILIYIVPQLEFSGHLEGSLVLKAIRFVYSYIWLLIPVLLVVLTIIITRLISSRWQRLVIAWSG